MNQNVRSQQLMGQIARPPSLRRIGKKDARKSTSKSLTQGQDLTLCQAASTAPPVDNPQESEQQPTDIVKRQPGQIPPEIENNVAVLSAENPNTGQKTKVYVLGISHISKKSLSQIEMLMASTAPDLVMLEMCKDRFSLLQEPPTEGKPRYWHTDDTGFQGVPLEAGYPTEDELRSLLRVKLGRPISRLDVEADCLALQATGLFGKVRPVVNAPKARGYPPAFIQLASKEEEGSLDLFTVNPLEDIEFILKERILPPITALTIRVDSSLKGVMDPPEEQLQEMAAEPKKKNKNGQPSLMVYMKLRQDLIDMMSELGVDDGEVVFYNVENGDVEVVLRKRKFDDGKYRSGLEPSAEGGQGFGIDSYQRLGGPVRISDKLILDPSSVEVIRKQQQAPQLIKKQRLQRIQEKEEKAKSDMRIGKIRTKYREWTDADFENKTEEGSTANKVAEFFASFLTRVYSTFQSKAADKVGVSPGDDWKVAMLHAARNGAAQVILCDRPAMVTQDKMVKSMFERMTSEIFATVALIVGTTAVCVNQTFPDYQPYIIGGCTTLSLVLLWPILQPLLEIFYLSTKGSDEIESLVLPSEKLQDNLDDMKKQFGEDALLNWPGAMEPLITERDQFMARVIKAAAQGRDAMCPAFILDEVDGMGVWRYMTSEFTLASKAGRVGQGDGVFQPIEDVKTIVAVVGTAHVRGICKEWERLQSQDDLSVEYLLEK